MVIVKLDLGVERPILWVWVIHPKRHTPRPLVGGVVDVIVCDGILVWVRTVVLKVAARRRQVAEQVEEDGKMR